MSLQAPIAPVVALASACRTTPWNSRGLAVVDCPCCRKLMYDTYASVPSEKTGGVPLVAVFGALSCGPRMVLSSSAGEPWRVVQVSPPSDDALTTTGSGPEACWLRNAALQT